MLKNGKSLRRATDRPRPVVADVFFPLRHVVTSSREWESVGPRQSGGSSSGATSVFWCVIGVTITYKVRVTDFHTRWDLKKG